MQQPASGPLISGSADGGKARSLSIAQLCLWLSLAFPCRAMVAPGSPVQLSVLSAATEPLIPTGPRTECQGWATNPLCSGGWDVPLSASS